MTEIIITESPGIDQVKERLLWIGECARAGGDDEFAAQMAAVLDDVWNAVQLLDDRERKWQAFAAGLLVSLSEVEVQRDLAQSEAEFQRRSEEVRRPSAATRLAICAAWLKISSAKCLKS